MIGLREEKVTPSLGGMSNLAIYIARAFRGVSRFGLVHLCQNIEVSQLAPEHLADNE
jgi:hypothetical protein